MLASLTVVTDAHVHPTDKRPTAADYDAIPLGCLAAMSTYIDQDDVKAIADRPDILPCFGYHPWYVHRYYLGSEPSKRDHYLKIMSPKPKQIAEFDALLPQLPDPEPFEPLLEAMRENIKSCNGIVGEIGLDATARVRIWPPRDSGEAPQMTPFRTSMAHQTAICKLQLELADELGVAASLHCVNASGATMDLLKGHRGNACIHSCGGMSPDFITQLARSMPNVYFSPSILITARSGDEVVRAVPRDRMLVESDTSNVADITRLVWGATVWISTCKGWKLETESVGKDTDEELFDDKGHVREPRDDEVWTVQTLERNWNRFIGR